MTDNKDNTFNRQIIIVDDEPKTVPGQGEGETPVITIEEMPSDLQRQEASNVAPGKPSRQWLWFACGLIISALLCVAAVIGWRYYRTYQNIGVPVSTTSEQNIAKLQAPSGKATPKVTLTSDSVLGVAMNFYEISGLKAEVTLEEPDTADNDVYLYSHCADYGKNNQYLGSIVMNGKQMQSDNSRLGYCGMANDNIVIGIARDEDVRDYVVEAGGSFFRQFILVSNGVIPDKFHLHGKVERRGLGRIGEKLYYIETKHAETMWDFADALREYGFVDAIYITGGDDYSFYRTSDGVRHDIGDAEKYPHKKEHGVTPWIVFRKK